MGTSAAWTVLWTVGACCPALASIIEIERDLRSESESEGGPQWAWEEPVFGPDEFPDLSRQPYVHLDGAWLVLLSPAVLHQALHSPARKSSHKRFLRGMAAVEFTRDTTADNTGYIEVLMYHIDNREYVGRWLNDGVRDATNTRPVCNRSRLTIRAALWPCADLGAVVVWRGASNGI